MVEPVYVPIYDISKSYEENLAIGPNSKYKATFKPPLLKKKYTLLGFKINSPFGSSASPTGADSRYIKAMFDNGYDIVTTKTRRSIHYLPNPMQHIVHIVPGRLEKDHDFEALPARETSLSSEYKTLTLANSFGNNSIDPKYWVPDSKKANDYAKDGKLLITSIVGTIQNGFTADDYYQDFVTAALLAKQSGARAIEINFSCPNVMNEGVLCYDKDAVATISKMVKTALGNTPILAKLGYFPSTQQTMLEEVIAGAAPYLSAISAINTFAAPIYDEQGNQALPGHGRLKAGVSGHAIKEIGIDMTSRLHKLRRQKGYEFEIIGIGGVLTPRDFQDYRNAGADAVLSATGAMWNPNLAAEVKKYLSAEENKSTMQSAETAKHKK
jgi:dihydroorotate dehydrogenase (NAD+) catalytic subunit